MKADNLDLYQTITDSLTVDEITLNSRRITDFSEISSPTVRQTYLSGPDLIGVDTTSTVETAATVTGDLRSTYHDFSVDMLTGSRGGMIITKDKTGNSTFIQASIFGEVRDYVIADGANTSSSWASGLQQFLATGCQLSSASTLTSANLWAFQTTKREVINGVLWEWNPESGFAMWRYTGTGSAFNLTHPMGKVPLFFAIKDLDVAYDWITGRAGTTEYMRLNTTAAETSGSIVFIDVPTDTYISIGTASNLNNSGDEFFGFGWFGDPLDDLETGMLGERGVTASLEITGSDTYSTGITDIQTVIFKRLDGTSNWMARHKASGWDKYTYLNTTDAEGTAGSFSVTGSDVFVNVGTDQYIMIVIGSTADRPDNQLKTDVKVLRKVGTAASSHRVDFGPMAGGTAGGMLFGRDITNTVNNRMFDTIRGITKRLLTDASDAEATVSNDLSEFTTTGVTLNTGITLNSTNVNQYSVFLTTHQATMTDGSYWEYNPLTGFAMCKYTGTGVVRTLDHPMLKKPRMMWIKNLDNTIDWIVYFNALGATGAMNLNLTNIFTTASNIFNDTEPTSTEITLGTSAGTNTNTENYILYGWFGNDLTSETGNDLVGELGSSAFYHYVANSGSVTIETGIEDISCLIFKSSTLAQNWWWLNTNNMKYYSPNSSAIEGDWGSSITIDGSKLTFTGSTGDIEIGIFGSKVDSGLNDYLTLPASSTDPAIFNLASGFNASGSQDEIVSLTTSQNLTVTGSQGKKYIVLKDDGILYFTDTLPTYERGFVPYANGKYTFDIDNMKMYYNGSSINAIIIGECWLDNVGNVYDVRTYAKGNSSLIEESISVLSYSRYTFDNPFGHKEVDMEVYFMPTDNFPDHLIPIKWMPYYYSVAPQWEAAGPNFAIDESEIVMSVDQRAAIYIDQDSVYRRTTSGYYKIISKRTF